MRQAIDRLENNFEAGDAVVDVIGFSRGAALALSFANELTGKLPRVSIRFMGDHVSEGTELTGSHGGTKKRRPNGG